MAPSAAPATPETPATPITTATDVSAETKVFLAPLLRAVKKNIFPDQDVTSSQRAAPIYIRAHLSSDTNSVNFQYVDGKCRLVSTSLGSYITRESGLNQATMNFLAMYQLDHYSINTIHEYNMSIAIFFARDLLKHWVAGNPVHTSLNKDDMNLVLFQLCRNIDDDTRALKMLQELPAPTLF
ncbi:hypothetical protein MGYG_05999 [Nannizzia gypsea CBS 118893]|uniref:Uncharacterized protein n=1 Tax=Arthroderma gypseum (strain ATCC MYA-4604 / CBS 118893) TaxID=535722 RepID=E4V062_ARTGP|nr:hypothetical protein MGYG_05999 [Nannizzia gypsea CBS 118893]EFR02999.1 hypothetical protein MGYG_05999 [Nannizzia gypsea CBS 118893]